MGSGLGINTGVYTVVCLHTQGPGSCVIPVSGICWTLREGLMLTISPKYIQYNPEGALIGTGHGGLIGSCFLSICFTVCQPQESLWFSLTHRDMGMAAG